MDTNSINSNILNTPVSSVPSNLSTTSFDWKTMLIIVVVLALLGFNIFVYLANGTEGVLDIIRPITKNIALICKCNW